MNKPLIITISVIAGVLLLAILIYYFATKKGKLEQTKQDIIQQKLENAPESRADLQKLIDEAKNESIPFTSAWVSDPARRRGGWVTGLPVSPVIGIGKPKDNKWIYTWAELESIIDYYKTLISGYQTQYDQLI